MPTTLEKPLKTIRDVAVQRLTKIVSDYSDWYEDHGLYLPPAFAADPTGWTEALHKMKRAFKLLTDYAAGEGELWKAKHEWEPYGEQDTDKINELEKEIQEGFSLFGSQLYFLTDPKKGVESDH